MSEIREIKNQAGLSSSIDVIHRSFKTVADRWELTGENCPTNAAFLTLEQLASQKDKATFFGLYKGSRQVGFAAIEDAQNGIFYLNKLSVLPGDRNNGYGRELVKHVEKYVDKKGGTKIALGMIDKDRELKKWYLSLGFIITETKSFSHLPFSVCLMEKRIER